MIFTENTDNHCFSSFLACVLSLLISFCTNCVCPAQTDNLSVELRWQEPATIVYGGQQIEQLAFEGCSYGFSSLSVPTFSQPVEVCCSNITFEAHLDSIVAVECSEHEARFLSGIDGNQFILNTNIATSRDNSRLVFSILPFRKVDGGFEKLVSCSIVYSVDYSKVGTEKSGPAFARQSVLATGDWFKFAVSETGVHKVSYSDLSSAGVDVSNGANIRFYHNGGGVLPEANASPRFDDLVEIPASFQDVNSNGVFDSQDFFIVYLGGPVAWNYNSTTGSFERINNPYDDHSYLFVTSSLGAGKRIAAATVPTGEAVSTVTEFLDYKLIEHDQTNLNRMGSTWFGDVFGTVLTRSYSFSFPNIAERQHTLAVEVAARCFSPSAFKVFINEQLAQTIAMGESNDMQFASVRYGRMSFGSSDGNISVGLQYVQGATSGTGYLDYLAVNAWRKLIFADHQMRFRNPELQSNSIYEFELTGSNLTVWDISVPTEPKRVEATCVNGKYSFNALGSSTFVAFDGQSFNNVSFAGKVANQNLHALRNIDYLIVAHPDFKADAEALRALHARYDDLQTEVVVTDEIYNEFGCGATDVSAIRDFVRMLYLDSDSGHEIKYLLLFGDASFDVKNRSGKVCFIPTHESLLSTHIGQSLCTDDFFGCMDETEGEMGTGDAFNNVAGIPDVGVGRFTVSTPEQATQMVAKVGQYMFSDSRLQSWRNVFAFSCDDGEVNEFIKHAEQLAELSSEKNPNLVIDKIYLDALEQESAPGGQKAPAMNKAINDRMEKGALLFNYTGHAGEIGFAEECILENGDIFSWRNSPRMPLMITASCEFGRYDDHVRTSSAEYAFLNAHGGPIALITAARVTYGAPNFRFNRELITNLLKIEGGNYLCFGDAFRRAKTEGDKNDKSYILIGDPALRLALPNPDFEVVTTGINGTQLTGHDTISALQKVTVEGVVKKNNAVDTDFNGMVYVSVYDKEQTVTTYGDESDPYTFNIRNSMVFNGKTNVENGTFSVSFTVPKDINYSFGNGLISYYATDGSDDASGSYSDFVIGGFSSDYEPDDEAPEIELFIDDYQFVDGGLTSQTPILLARLRDEHGINTTGMGIGHNITATLTGATNASFVLNDCYEAPASFDEYGRLEYRMSGLNDGEHTLRLKVWDVYNNSSEAEIHFVVVNSSMPSVANASNYPNPATDCTYFIFDHNLVGNEFDVDIQIFDLAGTAVAQIKSHQVGAAIRSNPVRWNCCSGTGARLKSGLYIYRVLITSAEGQSYSQFSKLVIQ